MLAAQSLFLPIGAISPPPPTLRGNACLHCRRKQPFIISFLRAVRHDARNRTEDAGPGDGGGGGGWVGSRRWSAATKGGHRGTRDAGLMTKGGDWRHPSRRTDWKETIYRQLRCGYYAECDTAVTSDAAENESY